MTIRSKQMLLRFYVFEIEERKGFPSIEGMEIVVDMNFAGVIDHHVTEQFYSLTLESSIKMALNLS